MPPATDLVLGRDRYCQYSISLSDATVCFSSSLSQLIITYGHIYTCERTHVRILDLLIRNVAVSFVIRDPGPSVQDIAVVYFMFCNKSRSRTSACVCSIAKLQMWMHCVIGEMQPLASCCL